MGHPLLASSFEYEDINPSSAAQGRTAFVRESVNFGLKGLSSTTAEQSQRDSTATRLTPRVLGSTVNYRPFTVLQQWEGTVIESSATAFVARLVDKTGIGRDEEEVEIDLDEIDIDDRKLVKPGSSFYWAIGYEDAPGVPRQRVSRIRFRRLPGWTRRELDRAALSARRLESLFV